MVFVSRYCDSRYPVVLRGRGGENLYRMPPDMCLGGVHRQRDVDARNNGECRVQTAVSQFLGYERALAHSASVITKGDAYGNFRFQESIDSQTAGMGEGEMGPKTQEPEGFKIVDMPWTPRCLGNTAV